MKSPGKEVPGIMRLETHDLKQGVPQNRKPDAKVIKTYFHLCMKGRQRLPFYRETII